MAFSIQGAVFPLENQDGCGEETIMDVQPTHNGKVSISFSGESVPSVFVETYGQEIRILIYREFEEEPEIIVLDTVSGGW